MPQPEAHLISDQVWSSIQHDVSGRRNTCLVETWYLCGGVMEVCRESRAVQVDSKTTLQTFEEKCRIAWADHITRDDIRWSIVTPTPRTSSKVCAHVILTQGFQDDQAAALAHSIAWPILRRYRATIFHQGATVLDIVRKVDGRRLCESQDITCRLDFLRHGQSVHVESEQEVRLAETTVLWISVTHRDSADGEASDDDISTTFTNEEELCDLEEESDEFSGVTANTVQARTFEREPYPWEVEYDNVEDLMEDEEEEYLVMSNDHQNSMLSHAQQMRQHFLDDDMRWTAVTFGVGLVELGRRDVPFTWHELPNLRDKIILAWQDHLQHAESRLLFVTPQPTGLALGPHIVLLIALDYDGGPDVFSKAVLVCEENEEREEDDQRQPYGALLYSPLSAMAVAAQLGHHECFPNGIQVCHATLGGVDLEARQRHDARDGDLCELRIEKYPEYVDEADYQMVHAERFFQLARSHFENRIGSVQIIIRCHGISPENRPLGSRDYVVDYPDLKTLNWIREVKALWPFAQDTAGLIFVQQMSYWKEEEEVPIMHVILSYARDREGKPILVNQRLHEVHTDTTITESWAVVVREQADETMLQEDLFRHPFWFHSDRRTHMYRENRRLNEVEIDWRPGDVVDLAFNVVHKSGMLGALREMGSSPAPYPYEETDGTGFLQTTSRIHHQGNPTDEMPDDATHQDEYQVQPQVCYPRDHKAWVEIYHAYKERVKEIFQENDIYKPSLAVRLEDNSDLQGANWEAKEPERSLEHVDPDGLINTLNDGLHKLTYEPWQGLNQDFTVVPCHHPMVAYAIEATCQMPPTRDSEVYHIYTDVSSKGNKATWAFVILKEVWMQGVKHFARVAFAVGEVCDEIGPYAKGAMDAEATALIATSECLLAMRLNPSTDVYLHYDAMVVGHAAIGLQQLPRSKYGDVSFRVLGARIMLSLVQKAHRKVCGIHVHSHEGSPFNEMADSLAAACREGWQPPVQSCLKSGVLLQHKLKEWAWLQISPTEEMPTLETMLTCQDGSKCGSAAIDLKFGTVNVGTMGYQEQDGLAMGHKAAELMRQFHDQGYDVVALQETRAKFTQMIRQGPFLRLISAAKQGQGGIEVWFNVHNLEHKLGSDIQPQNDITIWRQDARTLAVAVNMPGLSLSIVAIYAPQAGRSHDEITDWWGCLRQTLNQKPDLPLCVLGDCNAKVGSVTASCIGMVDPDFEDVAGTCLRELCEDFDMVIPSTMESYHVGESATYHNPRHCSSRIDYFALSTCCQPGIVATSIDDTIDVLNGDRDHRVLQMKLQITKESKKQGMMRVPMYDRQAARNQCAGEDQSVVHSLPQVAWTIDVNQHWSIYRDCLQENCSRQYPRVKRKKRQLYINDAVWQMVCDRKDLRQQHRAQIRDLQKLILQQCFAAWANRGQEAVNLDVDISTATQQHAVTLEARQNLDKAFRQRKAQNWKDWIEETTSRVAGEANNAKGVELFHILKPKEAIAKHQGKMKKSLPGLQAADGQWVHGRQQISCAWQKQFGAIENAVTKDMNDMIVASKPQPLCTTTASLTEIPSIYDFESSIRGLSTVKAPGLDGIGGEIYRQDPIQTAQKFYPMLLKCSLRRQWITEFSGGWLIPLHKGKMAASQMEGYRGILLEPSMGRCFGKTWRPKIEAGFASCAAAGQWGGRRGLSIEALHLNLRLAQSTARHQHQSFAMIFVDIRAAFYSIAKPLLCPGGVSYEDAVSLCQIMKIPSTAVQVFMDNLQNCRAVDKATNSQVTEGMVSATLSQSWFCIPHGDATSAPLTGSRPGDPCADTLFGLIMSVILNEIQDRLAAEQIYPVLPDDELALAPSLTWVDDTVFMVQTSAEKLCDKVEQVLATVLEVMQEHGLQLSFGPNKTAVIMEFHGPHSKKAKQTSEARYKGHFHILSEHLPPVKVPIVQHYRYLGGFMIRGGMLTPEIRVRAAQTMAKMKGLTRILRNKQLDVTKKRLIVKSIAFPILSLHSGSWFDLTQGDFQTWKSAVFKLYGTLLERGSAGEIQHTDLYDRAFHMQASMPMEWLLAKRLQLCAQIFKEGDVFMFSAIVHNHRHAQQSSWLSGLWNAFVWLGEQIGSQPIPHEVQFLDKLQTWHELRTYGPKLSQQIKKALKAHQHRIRTLQELKGEDRKQQRILLDMEWQIPPDEQEQPDTSAECVDKHCCAKCDAVFASQAALAVHEQKKHDLKMAVRKFAPTPTCAWCHKWYHTRPRLLLHLQWSGTNCWHEIMRHFEPLSQEQVDELDNCDRVRGEALHQAGLKTYERDQAWRWATPEEVQMISLNAIQGDLPQGEPSQRELDVWGELGALPPGRGGRAVTKRKLQDKTVHNVIADTNNLEATIKATVVKWKVGALWIPRPLSEGRKFFLIFFAGHRRAGDMASWIAQETNLIPIPIDTAIHEHFGNVFLSDLWEQLIRSRRVAGGHAGPPCETFSLARWNQVETEGARRQPRPLRSALYPWGLPDRNLREVFQTMVGTTLYARVLTLLLLIHCHNGCFTLEHPAGPGYGDKHEKWSIWQSAFVLRALRDPHIARIQFLQGPLGRPYAKPTGMLVSRLPFLAKSLYKGYQPGWKASVKLGGKAQDGRWKTHVAKEYPEAMCKILAVEYGWYERQLATSGWEAEPSGLEEALSHLTTGPVDVNFDFAQQMGEDFQPHLVL